MSSAITLPVPRLRLIPQGPCPAARNTPPSAPVRVATPTSWSSGIRVRMGAPESVTGRKQRPSRMTSRSDPLSLLSEMMRAAVLLSLAMASAEMGAWPGRGGRRVDGEFRPAM